MIKRNSSLIALASRVSQLDLFGAPSLSLTPDAITEEALNTDPFGGDSRRNSRQLTLPADARKLLHSDADAPEWGSTTHVYGQPRSRAGPLPSRSVTDLSKLRGDAAGDVDFTATKNKKKQVPSSPSSAGGEYDEWTIVPALRGNGALFNAIQAANSEDDLGISWVGTLGFPTDALPDETKAQIEDKLATDHNADIVFVSDEDFSGHYAAFCKVILWPLFHYQVPDDVNSKAYMDRSWSYYYNVNHAFADKLVESYRKDDTIWIHDYHLLLVPNMVRTKRPEAKIGFFLHTAFPSSEIFRCQMKYKDLLNGMLGANLVAFQLQEYADHFLSTCSRFLQVEALAEGVQLEDRFVNVTAQPIGINTKEIDSVRRSEAFDEAVKILQTKYQGMQLIVSRDRLDRVHGVRQKLQAYERFLDQFPHRAGDTVLLQVISPNQTPNKDLLARISEIQNRINSKHGSLTRQPLEIHEQNLNPAQYYALLTVGDALMVTTLRDGMNLTGHEFVFCQDGHAGTRYGALILSEFAGCAEILKSDILRINPWNIRQQTGAITTALNMDVDTRKIHWEPLYKTVTELTGGHWFHGLSRLLTESHKAQGNRAAVSVPRLQAPDVSKAYDQASHRLFILDYEGTLIARQTGTGAMLTSPYRVIDVLNDLIKDPINVVYVTSGSSSQQLTHIFQTANGIGLIAENGCYLLPHGELFPRYWKAAVDKAETMKWKNEVGGILKYYQDRLAGSVIEERDSSMEFNFANVEDKKVAERQSGDCIVQINGSCETLRVRAVRKDSETILIEQMDCTKATMAEVIYLALKRQGAAPDFLLVAGNDREDEPAFRWANELGKDGKVRDVFTVSIGNRDTEARAAMSKGSSGMLSVLEKLAHSSLKDRPVESSAKKKSTQSVPRAFGQVA